MRELLIKVVEELGFVNRGSGSCIYEYGGDCNSHNWLSILDRNIILSNGNTKNIEFMNYENHPVLLIKEILKFYNL